MLLIQSDIWQCVAQPLFSQPCIGHQYLCLHLYTYTYIPIVE